MYYCECDAVVCFQVIGLLDVFSPTKSLEDFEEM